MVDFNSDWLRSLTPTALAVKKVARFELVFPLRSGLYAAVDVAQRYLLTGLDVPDGHDELGSAAEDANAIGTAAVIDQVRRTIEPVAASDKRLLANTKRVDLQQAVDVHDQSEVLDRHSKLGAPQERYHRVSCEL